MTSLFIHANHLGKRDVLLSSNDNFASSQRKGAINHLVKHHFQSERDVYAMVPMDVSLEVVIFCPFSQPLRHRLYS